jgi:MFS family permease
MLQVGSTVGALTLCRWLGRHRFFAVTVLFVIAVPVVASIGYAGVTSRSAVIGAAFFAGFCVLGIQSGINVAGALIYPTSLRADGSGWELGIGRLGSIAGPLLAALFVGLPVQQLYLWSALPWRSAPSFALRFIASMRRDCGAPVAARAARAHSRSRPTRIDRSGVEPTYALNRQVSFTRRISPRPLNQQRPPLSPETPPLSTCSPYAQVQLRPSS